jgi:hypothetical protein
VHTAAESADESPFAFLLDYNYFNEYYKVMRAFGQSSVQPEASSGLWFCCLLPAGLTRFKVRKHI